MDKDWILFIPAFITLAFLGADAFQCYQKGESECIGSDTACEFIRQMAGQNSATVVDCDRGIELCMSFIASGTVPSGTFNMSRESCDIWSSVSFEANRCYNREEMEEVSPQVGLYFGIQAQKGVTFTSVLVCTCDESLCNNFANVLTTLARTTTTSNPVVSATERVVPVPEGVTLVPTTASILSMSTSSFAGPLICRLSILITTLLTGLTIPLF